MKKAESVDEKVTSIAPKLEARAAEREAFLKRFPWMVNEQPGMTVDDHVRLALEWVNERYALVDQRGDINIASLEDFAIYSEKSWRMKMAPWRVATGDKPVELARLWIGSPDRREGRLGAWPIGQEPEGGINMWRGFGVEPSDVDWPMIDDYLLNVLCAGDEAAHAYLVKLLAWKVQHPTLPPEVAIVLRSTVNGTGKSTLSVIMQRLFGDAAKSTGNAKLLFGEFGEILVGAQVITLEEALFASDPSKTDAFKTLVTERQLTVNMKYRAPVTVPNLAMFIVNTNHAHAIAADSTDRRHLMLEVSDAHRGDTSYWNALYAEINGDALGGFLRSMQEADLGDWHPRDSIPQTEALTEQKMHSLPPLAQWVDECLSRGDAFALGAQAGQDWSFEVELRIDDAHEAYLRWSREGRRERFAPMSLASFRHSGGLRRWLPLQLVEVEKGRAARENIPRRHWRMAHLDACRAHFADAVAGRTTKK